MSRIVRFVAAADGILIAVSLAVSAAANAVEPPAVSTHACWMELDTGLSLCAQDEDDLAAAVLRAYGLTLVIDDKESFVADVTAATTTVIGIIYDNVSYGTPSFAVSVSGSSGCSTGTAYGYTDLSTIGWNNRISSFRSYAGCKTAIFDGTNYTGTSYGYVANASAVGSMDNKASSIRWAP